MPSSFHFFSGKGGVGKTTCAVAFAFSRRLTRGRRRRTLIVSTDPAHSLGDVIGKRLGPTPRAVGPGVRAMELDAERAFARWMRKHRRALADAIEHGTWLDRRDADALLDLTVPGIDELAGLIEIGELANGSDEEIVVDTAPTGHTLRLLAAPEAVAAVASVLDALQEEHRIIRRQFARVAGQEAADRLIALLGKQAAQTAALLRDPQRTAFHWVTLPEKLAVAETDDGLDALARAKMPVVELIVNRVLPPGEPCPICGPRRTAEHAAIAELRKRYGKLRIVHERGAQGSRGSRGSGGSGEPQYSAVVPESMEAVKGAQLIFVGGKGGVGKTTVAAALGIRLARARPDASVLLLSTDPAHSLGDALDATLGDDARHVAKAPENLTARELDAAAALAAKRDALRGAIGEVGGTAAEQVSELLDLAPPGIDELFGALSILESRSSHRVIVVDTAPTGHALRLLELPETARDWVQMLLRLLLKYKDVVRPGPLAAELVDASRSIRELQALLHDHSATRFLVVTRPAAVPRAETERLLVRLRQLKLSVPAVVVNACTQPRSRCRICLATARAEAAEIVRLQAVLSRGPFRGCAIIQTPLQEPPPRGAAALDRWAQTWSSVDSISA